MAMEISVRSRYEEAQCSDCGATIEIDADAPGGPQSISGAADHEDDCPRQRHTSIVSLRPKARKEITVYQSAIHAATTARKRLGRTMTAIHNSDDPGKWTASMELARAYDQLTTTIANLEASIKRVQDHEAQVARAASSAP